jgi:hypothetical protein
MPRPFTRQGRESDEATKKKLPAHEVGSGNIFADLGPPNAEMFVREFLAQIGIGKFVPLGILQLIELLSTQNLPTRLVAICDQSKGVDTHGGVDLHAKNTSRAGKVLCRKQVSEALRLGKGASERAHNRDQRHLA